MKKTVLCVLLASITVLAWADEEANVSPEFEAIPTTIEEYIELRNVVATTPEGGAAMFVLAMVMYVADNEVGLRAFTVALDSSQLIEREDGFKGYSPNGTFLRYLNDYLKPLPYLAASYVAGTSPQEGYELPELPLRFIFSKNTYSVIAEDQVKIFVGCSGADSPRPLILKRNSNGHWKAANYNSLFVGIRKPVTTKSDPL